MCSRRGAWLGFLLFFVASLAESNRTPFDLPEAESEIIAGYFTEYSGFKFALFFLGEYLGMFAITGLGITLFLGGWTAPFSFLHMDSVLCLVSWRSCWRLCLCSSGFAPRCRACAWIN